MVAIEPLWSLVEVAKLLGISKNKTWVLTRDGELPGIRVGRHWRFRRADVERYLDQHRNRPLVAVPGPTTTDQS